MQDRETVEIVTPVGQQTVVLRAWINGREKQKIDGSLFRGMQTSGDGRNLVPKISETMLSDQENAAIEAVVVSVDNNTTNVVDLVLDMRAKDYSYVLSEVQAIVQGDLDEKKELASGTNTGES